MPIIVNVTAAVYEEEEQECAATVTCTVPLFSFDI